MTEGLCHQGTLLSRTFLLSLLNCHRYRAKVGTPDIIRDWFVYETVEMVGLASLVVCLNPVVCTLAVQLCARTYENQQNRNAPPEVVSELLEEMGRGTR